MHKPLQRIRRRIRPALELGDLSGAPTLGAANRRRSTAIRQQSEQPALRFAQRRRERRHHGRQRRLNGLPHLAASPFERLIDGVHLRNEVKSQEPARHLSKIDAQIPDARSVRHRKVRRDADEQFMQGEPLRPKYHEFAVRKAGEAVQLVGGGNAGGDVLGPKDRRGPSVIPSASATERRGSRVRRGAAYR